MTLKSKITLCAFASTMLAAAFFMMSNWIGRMMIPLIVAFKYYYFIFHIKTIKPKMLNCPSRRQPRRVCINAA